jgi:hypothetical protein
MKFLSKIRIILTGIIAITLFLSCSEYLEVVPDNTMKLEDVFMTKDDAYNALSKIYSYIPRDEDTHLTHWTLGDEYIGRLDTDYSTNMDMMRAIRIMRGLQYADDPLLGAWSGTRGGKPLYEGIRQCNVFLEHIDQVKLMTSEEREEWRSQAKFLKAYYHFLLIQRYGPIIIADKVISPEAMSDELFQKRSKVEDCFDYVINLIDEAIPSLREVIQVTSDYGMVDQLVAKSVKARILLFRASPFFSGNMEYFGDFYDPHDGQPYFPITDDEAVTKRKWKEALDAIDTAIIACEKNGKRLYEYKNEPYLHDRDDYEANPAMKTLYDLRMVVVDPWNEELIWGYSNVNLYNQGDLSSATNIRLPKGITGDANITSFSWQWMAATYQMAERYYTKNGLPVDEDKTYNYNGRHGITKSPNPNRQDGDPLKQEDSVKYSQVRGILQPNADLINLYLDRELRFYANLGITGGYWRAHAEKIPVTFFNAGYGGLDASSDDLKNDFLCTGIGIQKLVHPESKSGAWQRVVRFPFPIIRMADLYLMRAEARNEYEGPSQKVYDDINKVRNRAGIPNVETVWSDGSLAKNAGNHTKKIPLREIILRERSIELAFEGSRFWDAWRYLKAPAEFSAAIQGWDYTGTTPSSFFVLGVKQSRTFTVTDCLWPIDLDELNTNGNLKQNPGW